MKKFFAMLVVAVMLASLGALCVSADDGDWSPVGELTASYTSNLSDFITLDGDVSDWQANGFKKTEIDQFNLDAWSGEVDPNWSIDMWFSADAEYFYIAFKINDANVQAIEDGDMYNTGAGDAFQIQLDFNGWAANTEAFERAVFYSFGLQTDETVEMHVQCVESDTSYDYLISSDDPEEYWSDGRVLGTTKQIEGGWCAEVAISWQTLYNHAAQKLEAGGEEVPEFVPGEKIRLNMLVCYLDSTDGVMTGAWGTSAEQGSLTAGTGWYPEGAGMYMILDGMQDMTVEQATTAETEAKTEAETEAETEAKTESKTEAKTEAPAGEATTEAETEAAKSSCNGVIGAGAILAVLALGACVVAKKKD